MTSSVFDAEFWESRYRGHPGAHHRGSPNPWLVAEAGNLAPGRALDVGCGHGADALWLSARGWQVTAVDVSASALADAQQRAASHGDDVASRIDWVEADITSFARPEERFDLVSSHYVHVPAADREAFVHSLATAVSPGGSLLIVGHDASGCHDGEHGSAAEAYVTAHEVATSLHPATWDVLSAETRTRTDAGPNGQEVTLRDAVVYARRHR